MYVNPPQRIARPATADDQAGIISALREWRNFAAKARRDPVVDATVRTHLDACVEMCATLLPTAKCVRDFQLLFVNGELQGIQWASDGDVGEVLSNPRNISPPEGYTPVRGVLRSLLTCVPEGPRDKSAGIHLEPLNDEVRKMYEHLGFEPDPLSEDPDVLLLRWDKLDSLRREAHRTE